MSEAITPQRFHEADWRIVRDKASTHFRTGSFAAGVALVDAIGRLADAADHHPDVDLRLDGVTVRLRRESFDGLSEGDVALAHQISAAARELGVPVDLTGLQSIQVAIDALVLPDVMPFWRASRRRSPPVATSSATRTRWVVDPWPTPRATRSTSPVGRTATDQVEGADATRA